MPLAQTRSGPIWYADHRDLTMHRPTTILIHGAGGTHLDWPAELRRMPEASAIVVDLPGHGRSPGPARQSVPAYAESIFTLMDSLKIGRAIFGGQSMGGAIAMTAALTMPERTRGLILVSTGAKLGVHPDILNGILTELGKTIGLLTGWYYSASATEQMRRRTQQSLGAIPPPTLYADYAAVNQFDVRDQLGRIQAPTLIISGTSDQMTPFLFSEYLHDHIAGSQLVKVEGAGHMLPIEQPDIVADAVLKWLLAQAW
jgi:pimeloyl-ACP methyl ester carboxylesterase